MCGVRNGIGLKLNPWTMQFHPIIDSPQLRAISVGHSAKIWGVGESGFPYKYRIDGRWKQRGTRKIKHISVGADGGVWAIEENTFNVLRWHSEKNDWELIDPPPECGIPKRIYTTSKRSVMITDHNGKPWKWKPHYPGVKDSPGFWKPISNSSNVHISTIMKLEEQLAKLLYSKDKILGC